MMQPQDHVLALHTHWNIPRRRVIDVIDERLQQLITQRRTKKLLGRLHLHSAMPRHAISLTMLDRVVDHKEAVYRRWR